MADMVALDFNPRKVNIQDLNKYRGYGRHCSRGFESTEKRLLTFEKIP